MNKKIISALLLAGLSALGHAQSISSFHFVSFSDIFVQRTGNQIKVQTGAAPKVIINNVSYTVNSLFGVWALDDQDDMSATGVDQGIWGFDTNFASTGGIAGWKTNPNSGLGANQSVTLNYTSLTGTVEDFGFHLRTNETLPYGGNTAYFRGESVPEPASMLAIGAAVAGLIAKRRRK